LTGEQVSAALHIYSAYVVPLFCQFNNEIWVGSRILCTCT
jgi:hypothetical protein